MIFIITIDKQNDKKLFIIDEQISLDFGLYIQKQIGKDKGYMKKIQEIKIEGCHIDSFDFLTLLPELTHIYLLACKSDKWEDFKGTEHIISLGLHNLHQGRQYLSTTDFLDTFPNLEYLYVNLMGVSSYSKLSELQHLHTVLGVFRNENDRKENFDFSSFEHMQNLTVFSGYMAVDRHRIAAEAFIPIIMNPALESFEYCQMYGTEDKKLNAIIKRLHPSLMNTTLSNDEIMKIRREKFCQ